MKLCMSVFSPRELKVGMNMPGVYITSDGSYGCCWCFLNAQQTVLSKILCTDRVRFDLCHPYLERLPML